MVACNPSNLDKVGINTETIIFEKFKLSFI